MKDFYGFSCAISKLAIEAHSVTAMTVASTPAWLARSMRSWYHGLFLGERTRWWEVFKIKPFRFKTLEKLVTASCCLSASRVLGPFYGSNYNNHGHVTHLKKTEIHHDGLPEILVKVIESLRSNGCLQ